METITGLADYIFIFPNIVMVMKSRNIMPAEHATCNEHKRNTQNILVGKINE
jgi:hypothetical protein